MPLEIEKGNLPQELSKLILSKKCIVFIGSGPSTPTYGPWYEVVNRLCEVCGIDTDYDKNTPPKVLQSAAYNAKLSRRLIYYKFLSEYFGRHVDGTSIYYDILLSLPFECYLTVNFDPLLAMQARTARFDCTLPIHAYPSLDRRNMINRSIHYLHGFIAENATPRDINIVLSQDEFDEAYGENSSLINFLVPTLENDSILRPLQISPRAA